MRRRILVMLAAATLVLSGQAAADERVPLIQPDPLLTFPANPRNVDWTKVERNRTAKAQARAQKQGKPPLTHTEREPVGTNGGNDTLAKAERITGFGTQRKVTVAGDLAPDKSIPTVPAFAETNDAIPLAADTGIPGSRPSLRTTGTIGDGPHGSAGDRTGDFDFYKLSGDVDTTVTVETKTPTGDLDTFLVLWDDQGFVLSINDNVPGNTDSRMTVQFQPGRNFYVQVGAAGGHAIPADPMKPGTGSGVGTEGPYDLRIASGKSGGDVDYYSVDLRAGDVLGGALSGRGARLAVYDPAGREVMGSSQDLTGIFATDSPMPGGGNAVVDFVAPKAGRYFVGVEAGEGAYQARIEAFRPGTETTPRGTVQTIFLDFDGARVNTRIYDPYAGGLRDLSPLSRFLTNWGLKGRDENALIDAVVASVRENIEKDMAAKGTNPRFAVRILNSRDHADPWGQPNVSRVVVGGTVAETGIGTIGIAESIDAGNFGKEETALLLLDEISQPAGVPWSLNTYLKPQSNRIGFIGRAVGNIVAHEAGHMAGNWHQDWRNDIHGIMDPGGNPDKMFAVGPDGVGGTADDPDVDFLEEPFSPAEGFSGIEDTVNRTAWAYVRGTG